MKKWYFSRDPRHEEKVSGHDLRVAKEGREKSILDRRDYICKTIVKREHGSMVNYRK